MANKNNKGFSLVEVVVAIAVFAILIVPLTTQLISSVKTNSKTTKKQYAVEMAEELMEGFKVCELKDTIIISDGDSSDSDEYGFTKTGSETKNISFDDNGIPVTIPYTVDTYQCNDIKIGEKYEQYNCTVTVSSAAYAMASKGYVYDKNASDGRKRDEDGKIISIKPATGTIRNLDNNQAAIITGATYTGEGSGVDGNSLDRQAYAYFRDTKSTFITKYDVLYSQYMSGTDVFNNDTCDKYTTIKISKNGTKYLVECIVKYEDHTMLSAMRDEYTADGANIYYPPTQYGSGIVYKKEFDELPPIYLLYAPAIYNDNYSLFDHIRIDNSGMPSAEKESKVYIFETVSSVSETYKDVILEQFKDKFSNDSLSIDRLVYNNPSSITGQSGVNVTVKLEAGDKSKLKVYSNFPTYPEGTSDDIDVKDLTEDEDDSIYMYDIDITLSDSDGHKTTLSGTRGKE